MKKNWDIPCDFGTDVQEFEHYIGRKPKNNEEMEVWVRRLKQGMDAQLDWDIICDCASDEFK